MLNRVNRKKWQAERNAKKLIGRDIANSLPKVHKQIDVARMLGLSRVCVDTIESLALFKIFALMTIDNYDRPTNNDKT